jgi:hypothetical protein
MTLITFFSDILFFSVNLKSQQMIVISSASMSNTQDVHSDTLFFSYPYQRAKMSQILETSICCYLTVYNILAFQFYFHLLLFASTNR